MKLFTRSARRLAGPALVLLALMTTSAYGGGAAGGWGHGSLGDDDIGSLPSTVAPDAPSLLLVGTLADLHAAVLDVQGPGSLSLRSYSASPDRWILELDGTLEVALDARLLASDRVATLFSVGTTFSGGTAAYYAHGAWSAEITLAPQAIGAFPVSEIAGGGSVLAVHADAQTGESYTLFGRSTGDVLQVGQIVREPAR